MSFSVETPWLSGVSNQPCYTKRIKFGIFCRREFSIRNKLFLFKIWSTLSQISMKVENCSFQVYRFFLGALGSFIVILSSETWEEIEKFRQHSHFERLESHGTFSTNLGGFPGFHTPQNQIPQKLFSTWTLVKHIVSDVQLPKTCRKHCFTVKNML